MKTFFSIPLVLGFLVGSGVQAQEKLDFAQVYYWKAKPGKFDEYNKYIQQVAEPIDEEARKGGAFVSVTTYLSQHDSSQWTHMRVFLLKDSVQLQNLPSALDAAGVRLEPDQSKRKKRSDYTAVLRDFVGQEVLKILK